MAARDHGLQWLHAPAHDGDARAGGRQRRRAGRADAAATARDQGFETFKACPHPPSDV
jgi:hypothetical protein